MSLIHALWLNILIANTFNGLRRPFLKPLVCLSKPVTSTVCSHNTGMSLCIGTNYDEFCNTSVRVLKRVESVDAPHNLGTIVEHRTNRTINVNHQQLVAKKARCGTHSHGHGYE